jgi:hypothetical protein
VIVALALFGYAGLLLTAGAAALARARWPGGAPRLAMCLGQAPLTWPGLL